MTLLACAGESGPPATTVRDSVGVTIVENRAGQWQEGSQWIVETEPVLEIGLLDGPDEYLLSSVRSAVRLTDGTIAVGDRGGQLIRIYDSRGRHLASLGDMDGGPGELRTATLTVLKGDSLLAADRGTRRLSVFHPRDGFVRSVPVPAELGLFEMIGVSGDMAIGWGMMTVFRDPGSFGRDSASIVALRLDGSGFETMGRYPRGSRGYAFGLGPTSIAASGPEGFWFGDGDAYEMRHYDLNGDLALISRYGRTPQPITAEALAWIEEQWRSVPGGAATSSAATPDYYAPYQRAMSDSEGNLWVVSTRVGLDTEPTWRVFSPRGMLLGEVEMPTGFFPYQIGPDFVLVRHWDELQVEYVRLYRLHRNGRS